jgi:uncharacterized protein YndB with AHSA1/START domain
LLFFEADTTIAATPDAVWKVLIDAGSWPSWDSGIDSVDGKVALGSRITIRSNVAPGRAFPVKVTAFEPDTKLEFTGGMPLGMFKGVRTYSLSPAGSGTALRMREEYTGWMLGAFAKQLPDLNPSFRQFVDGLKARVQSGA